MRSVGTNNSSDSIPNIRSRKGIPLIPQLEEPALNQGFYKDLAVNQRRPTELPVLEIVFVSVGLLVVGEVLKGFMESARLPMDQFE